MAIVASVQNTPISGLTSFLPPMVVRNIITVGGAGDTVILGKKSVEYRPTSAYNVTSLSYADIPGLTINYTPVSATSKIEVVMNFSVSSNTGATTAGSNFLYCIVQRGGGIPSECAVHSYATPGDSVIEARRVFDSRNTEPQSFTLRARPYRTDHPATTFHETRAGATDGSQGWVGAGYSRLTIATVTVTEFKQAP
jgi:hypothetical protein